MTPDQVAAAGRLLRERNFAEAVLLANEILGGDPDDRDALALAGQAFLCSGRHGLAYAYYDRALSLAADFPEVWHQLGACLVGEHQTEDARRCFRRAIELDPNHVKAHVNLCALAMQDGDPHQAIAWGERALALEPGNGDAKYNLSTAYLHLGRWGEGWDWFDFGLANPAARGAERTYNESGPPLWDGTRGRTIVVSAEQGIGDEIMFASMLPDLQRDAQHVIFDCDPRLSGVFRRSFPGVEIQPTRFDQSLSWPVGRRLDCRIPIASLGKFYRRRREDFPGTPYLIADPERRLQWRALLETLPGRKKIGLAWTGGAADSQTRARSLTLEQLQPILDVRGCDFVSLEYRPPEDDLARRGIHHWKRAVEAFRGSDYDETLALVDALDLVICVTTSVLHAAGALGKPCWVLVPRRTNWRLQYQGETMPWNRSLRLFRQQDDWPIARVATELEHFVEGP